MRERAHRAAYTEAQNEEKRKKIKKEKRKAHTGGGGGQKGEEMGLQRPEKSGSRGFALVTILRVRVRILRIFNILEG